MYTLVTFGSNAHRDAAVNFLPLTSCMPALTWYYEAQCQPVELRDPSDDSLILSISSIADYPADRSAPLQVSDGGSLENKIHCAAAVILLAKHLPDGDKRREAMQALAGLLLRDGNDVEDVEDWLTRTAKTAKDPVPDSYAPIARNSKRRLADGSPVASSAKLQELVGEAVVKTFCRWVDIRRSYRGILPGDLDARLSSMSLNDIGNAERLVARFGDRIRYCHSWGCWLAWTGEVWARDEDGQIMRYARETAVAIYREAASLPVVLDGSGKDSNQGLRDELSKHASKTGNHNRLTAMIQQAETHSNISIVSASLDQNPWLFNVLNGTIDLRTGQMTPHRQEDLLTKIAPVAYDPDATCPTWLRFLDRVLPDADLQEYVCRIAGYTLSADTREQCLFFLFGGGRNGKSTFMETVIGMVGPYSTKTRSETLMTKRGGGVPNDVAALCGARLVSVAEVGEGQRLDEALVKDLVGQDTMQARFLFKEFFSFVPSHKLWMYGNHKPAIRGTDTGIWRRIKLIPFEVTIPSDEVDANLPTKLLAERSGILNWALAGCQRWQQEGLGEPEAVRAAVAEYRSEMDTLSQFLADCCVTGKRQEVTKADLYTAYKRWCDESGEYQVTSTKFGLQLKERGFLDTRTMTTRGWRGIGLLAHDATVQVAPWTAPMEGATQEETARFEEETPWLN